MNSCFLFSTLCLVWGLEVSSNNICQNLFHLVSNPMSVEKEIKSRCIWITLPDLTSTRWCKSWAGSLQWGNQCPEKATRTLWRRGSVQTLGNDRSHWSLGRSWWGSLCYLVTPTLVFLHQIRTISVGCPIKESYSLTSNTTFRLNRLLSVRIKASCQLSFSLLILLGMVPWEQNSVRDADTYCLPVRDLSR